MKNSLRVLAPALGIPPPHQPPCGIHSCSTPALNSCRDPFVVLSHIPISCLSSWRAPDTSRSPADTCCSYRSHRRLAPPEQQQERRLYCTTMKTVSPTSRSVCCGCPTCDFVVCCREDALDLMTPSWNMRRVGFPYLSTRCIEHSANMPTAPMVQWLNYSSRRVYPSNVRTVSGTLEIETSRAGCASTDALFKGFGPFVKPLA